MKNFKQLLFVMSILVLFQYSCSKDNPKPEGTSVSVPSNIQIKINNAQNTATITGKADLGSEITLKYEDENGQVLDQIQADASGNFSITIDQLVDYEQELVAYAAKGDKVSETVKLNKIAAKAPYNGGWNVAKELIQAHRWKSDQTMSRIIIKQTQATPPYDMFATVAQKYLDFKPDGTFHFELTSPLQFTHTAGSWTMDENGVITIDTVIPLGPMQITNARIQHLDADRLTLLGNIADGLFILSMTKE